MDNTKLKTLKDLEEDVLIGYDVEELNKKITRKNVKGIIFKGVTSSNLKQEAIKHIKSGKMVEGAKYWAIDFFNITEEDLKGGKK